MQVHLADEHLTEGLHHHLLIYHLVGELRLGFGVLGVGPYLHLPLFVEPHHGDLRVEGSEVLKQHLHSLDCPIENRQEFLVGKVVELLQGDGDMLDVDGSFTVLGAGMDDACVQDLHQAWMFLSEPHMRLVGLVLGWVQNDGIGFDGGKSWVSVDVLLCRGLDVHFWET